MRRWILGVFILMTLSTAAADTAQMNLSLARLVNRLAQMQPLLRQAAREQPRHPRYRIHFYGWRDTHGVRHSGLMGDLNRIRQGIVDAINRTRVDPRRLKPLSGDFVVPGHV